LLKGGGPFGRPPFFYGRGLTPGKQQRIFIRILLPPLSARRKRAGLNQPENNLLGSSSPSATVTDLSSLNFLVELVILPESFLLTVFYPESQDPG